ncbi:MAG: methyl-accepting chemotaxis protein [Fimbriimonas sp.]|nr:methyl-accepting chemotaxis protein [Fimbriimonas sp.]
MKKLLINLSLGRKIGLAFGLMAVTFILMSMIALSGLGKLNKRLDLFKVDVIPGLASCGEMDDLFMNANIELTAMGGSAELSDQRVHAKNLLGFLDEQKGAMDKYVKTITVAEDRKNFDELTAAWDPYSKSLGDLAKKSLSGTDMAGVAASARKLFGEGEKMDVYFDGLGAWNEKNGQRVHAESVVAAKGIGNTLQAVAIVGTIVAVICGVALTRSITRPIALVSERLLSVADRCAIGLVTGFTGMAEGDLTYDVVPVTTPLPVSGNDEIGQMSETFNRMLGRIQTAVGCYNSARRSLSELIHEVSTGSNTVAQTSTTLAASSEEISATSSEISAGSDQLATNASEVAVIIEELHAQVLEVGQSSERQARLVDNASASLSEASRGIAQVDEAAKEMATSAASGNTAVTETVAAMERLKEQIEFSAAKVQELDAAGQKIGDIVKTIDSIAAQTNLLALNAAIEAARAGEHGRGFAVVADEVRKLAEQSSLATKEIGGLIGNVRATVKETVEAIQTTSNEAEDGVKRSTLAGAALKDILASSDKVKVYADQVAKVTYEATTSMENVALAARDNLQASQEMTEGTERVTNSITNVAAIAEEAAAGASEMTKGIGDVTESATNLSLLSGNLQEAVSKFKIDKGATATKFEVYENKAA